MVFPQTASSRSSCSSIGFTRLLPISLFYAYVVVTHNNALSSCNAFMAPNALLTNTRRSYVSMKPTAMATTTNKKKTTTRLWNKVRMEVSEGVATTDEDEALMSFLGVQSELGNLFYRDIVLVGAGAAGVGVSHALLRGGMDPGKLLLVDQGSSVGSSFRQWHNTTQFISPSWPGYPFGIQDLNAVVPDTAVNGKGQHPTGQEYASYLERMVEGSNLPLMLDTSITSIERIKQGCFIIKTEQGPVIIANYVVWCGGEWNSPRMMKDQKDAFPKDATVHYKHANVEELLSRRSGDDPIVLVGGGEAGADLGVALANRGANVMIVESSKEEEEDESSDPSRKLSPFTQERLERAADKIEFRTATKCTSAKRNGDKVTVTLESHAADKAVTTTVTTGANVVLCTGFDQSCNPILKDLFSWKNGSPEVTPTSDESTITKNLFLAGPALLHTLTCAPGEEKSIEDDDGEDETKNIIFCFVYKYRARFPVVAGEIIKRHVGDQHLMLQNDRDDLSDEGAIAMVESLKEIRRKCGTMQSFYQSKGMMLTDLSCAQLACGMAANDAPNYKYDTVACGCEVDADCETC